MQGLGVQILALLIRHALTAAGLGAVLDAGGIDPGALAEVLVGLLGMPDAGMASAAAGGVLALGGLGWSTWRKVARGKGPPQ